MEKRVKRIQSEEDLLLIRYLHERMVAQFLLEENPNLELIYEPREFTISVTDAHALNQGKMSTLPDFEVINPETEAVFILEVTESKSEKSKNRQKKIMAIANPGVPYIVFNRQDLFVIGSNRSEGGNVIFERTPTQNVQLVRQMIKPMASAAD